MGWGLIALYIIFPISSFVCSLISGLNDSMLKWIIPFIFGSAGILVPHIVFKGSGFDIIDLFFGLVPAAAGLITALIIRYFRNKKKRE